jgi:hypothetical protein
MFELNNPSVILDYLEHHPQIASLLPFFHNNTRHFFPDAELSLQLATYDNDTLFVYIETDLPFDEAYSRFTELDEGWYAELGVALTRYLNINLLFV